MKRKRDNQTLILKQIQDRGDTEDISREITTDENPIVKLEKLVKAIPSKERDFLNWFRIISSMLMNDFVISCKCDATKKYLRITELEPYFNDECLGISCVHPDDTAHCNELQKMFNKWYFHRPGKLETSGYKALSYLGLDICFGNTFAFGILIRAVEDTKTGEYFYGPSSLLTKCIFPSFGIKVGSSRDDYVKFMKQIEKESIWNNTFLEIVPQTLKKENTFFAPRIGLNPKKKYSNKPYRFMIKLEKQHLKRKEINEAIQTYKQNYDK